MATPPTPDITRLLVDWSEGRREALDQLMPAIYQELHKIAGSYLRRERAEHTLQPTALIHEAYLRLVGPNLPSFKSRTHFYGVAAHVMRQILVEHARARGAAKRGAGGKKVSLDDVTLFSAERTADLVALDDALTTLAGFDERKSKVIELRFFAGLSLDDTADALGVSVATISRELRLAQAWLQRELDRTES
jgi:RNA polymerase sigma factor (TIGR02999 family)